MSPESRSSSFRARRQVASAYPDAARIAVVDEDRRQGRCRGGSGCETPPTSHRSQVASSGIMADGRVFYRVGGTGDVGGLDRRPGAAVQQRRRGPAMATEQWLSVETLALNNDFRHPVETARETAGVALISGGRFELGIGAGHMKSEYDAAGIPFDDGGVRVSRLVEAAGAIRALLDGEPVAVDGAHYRIHADGGQLLPPR